MEYINIYNSLKQNTGKIIDRDNISSLGPDARFLAVHTCIMNSKNEMLMQKRCETKNLYPSTWDLSSGGFARVNESSIEAAKRELHEELGLNLNDEQFHFLCTECYGRVIDDIYIARFTNSNLNLTLQKEEVSDTKWADENTVLKMIDDGSFVDYNPELLIKIFTYQKKL